MNQLKLFLLLLLLAASGYASAAGPKDFEKHFRLLPQPQKIELLGSDKGISAGTLRFLFLQGASPRPVLYGEMASLAAADKPGAGTLTLSISAGKNLPASAEGYILEIRNGQVSVSARDQAGLFYGCQTLFQLLQDARDQQISIPACRITDYPDINYRAIHLDLKHHLDAIHYYYEMIDKLASVKINAIIVELEDKLRYRKSPLVGSDDAISIEEFMAISRYAKERNIEISPLVQGLGHASFILKHEEYKNLRDTITSDWSFDPMNPKTYELQFSLYEDAIAATPYGKYLHVGGDEVGSLGMSELSKKSGLTPVQLQMLWLSKVSDFAVKHHRIPIFWDDMLFKLSGLYQTTWDERVPEKEVEETWAKNGPRLDDNLSLFPKECVYMRWNYSAPDIPGNHRALDWYKSHGLKVMAATAAQTMWAMLPREQSNFQPVKDFSRITMEKKLDGILCTAWDDASPHFETYFRGFYQFAFFSWNYSNTTADQVQAIFRHRYYAPEEADSSFEFQNDMERSIVFWETALLKTGHRANYPDKETDLIDLPDAQQSGAWSEINKAKLDGARKAIADYQLISNKIKRSQNHARRNQYFLSLMTQLNEVQVYPAKLLLALEKYDRATAAGKQAAKQALAQYAKSFPEIRTRFEDVFSQTRILSNPPGYQLDQNQHHHLANGTKNSDWMYVYELAMNKKLENWLSD